MVPASQAVPAGDGDNAAASEGAGPAGGMEPSSIPRRHGRPEVALPSPLPNGSDRERKNDVVEHRMWPTGRWRTRTPNVHDTECAPRTGGGAPNEAAQVNSAVGARVVCKVSRSTPEGPGAGAASSASLSPLEPSRRET